MFNPLLLIYAIIVMALFLLMIALSMMFGANKVQGPAVRLRRKRLSDGLSPWLADLLIIRPVRDFEVLCVSSGVGYSAVQVLFGMAIVTIVVMLVTSFLKLGPLPSVGIGLVIGLFVPVFVIRTMRRRRMVKLVGQLPDGLDIIVRSLRVGHPVAVGIGMIGTEMMDPIGGEFRRVSQSMSYGLDLKDALEDLGARLDAPDIQYMVAAIRIQYSTGGNLSEVLSSLSNVMRERVRLATKVRALSAETRFSGSVMSVLPFLLVGALLFLRPDFYKDVPGNPTLQIIMGGALVLLFIGIVLMRRIVNIRV